MINKVAILMGSLSDIDKVKGAFTILKELQIPYDVKVLSAHRTTVETLDFALSAHEKYSVIICAAGMAAHLAGIVAANTLLPVIAIPISSTLNGLDALLSSVQMPSGIPVATVAIDGSKNAALLSAQIIALDNDEVLSRLIAFRKQNKKSSLEANDKLKEIL
ncbi:MAG: 5-(carboxyamino)imidazole ribonucleotide mutase [Spirochaetia bacterium]|nr:5-(carboxyamino)imidazole ribonucleotide mutase [Spirochaetia bacterium]